MHAFTACIVRTAATANEKNVGCVREAATARRSAFKPESHLTCCQASWSARPCTMLEKHINVYSSVDHPGELCDCPGNRGTTYPQRLAQQRVAREARIVETLQHLMLRRRVCEKETVISPMQMHMRPAQSGRRGNTSVLAACFRPKQESARGI